MIKNDKKTRIWGIGVFLVAKPSLQVKRKKCKKTAQLATR
jgi:hypothetical protein|tara:strand:- start:485 stop:604 length:120 start_codon:yes stop_codon:yes gene_type:complete